MLQRFQLTVQPDTSPDFTLVDRTPDRDAKQDAYDLVHSLVNLDAASIGAEWDVNFDGEEEGVPFIRFDEKAQIRFDKWYVSLEERVRSGEMHPTIESHLSKYRSLVPSLALILHLSDECGSNHALPKGPVTDSATQRAIELARYLESHAMRIYSAETAVPEMNARQLGRRILDGDLESGFTVRDVYRKAWSGMSKKDSAQAAVDVLVDHGWLQSVADRNGNRGFTKYEVNPSLDEAARSALLPERTVA